jgi:hypothetical protein
MCAGERRFSVSAIAKLDGCGVGFKSRGKLSPQFRSRMSPVVTIAIEHESRGPCTLGR